MRTGNRHKATGNRGKAVGKQREGVNRLDAKCFLSALCASAVNPIFDFRLLISVLSALLFALCLPVEAQQPDKIPLIGYLSSTTRHSSLYDDAFRQGLRDLGYRDRKNIVIEYRYADGKSDRLDKLAAELVQLKVNVIVTSGAPPVIHAARKATRSIPIVMRGSVVDPVVAGFVTSLAKPYRGHPDWKD